MSGIDKVKVNLSNCCNPIYGDDIIGYITKGNGISIHRSNCHNIAMLDHRLVEVNWNQNFNTDKRYLAYLVIYSKKGENSVAELVQKISMMNISIEGIRSNVKQDESTYEVGVYVRNLEHLNKLLLDLNKLSYISKIERLMR